MRERTVSSRVAHKGRILDLEVLDVELENGVRSVRDIVRHGGAVGVLARLPDGSFLLVQQYRKPFDCEMIEIIAGGLEKGESPAACAARETREETGYTTASLVELGVVVPAPGYSSEQLFLFYAELAQAGKSCPDADEHVQPVRLTELELDGMIERNEIKDAKTIAAWHLWKARRK